MPSPPVDISLDERLGRFRSRLGRFTVKTSLAPSGFGQVHRVSDPLRPSLELALKVLPSASSSRVLEEVRASRSVEHRVVVSVLELGTLEDLWGAPYLLTEYISGFHLRPPFALEHLPHLAAELLSALEAIHAAGWRHGDLHPGNILVGVGERGLEPHLLDFGLSEEIARAGGRESRAGGAPRYLPPEALRRLPLDHRADLYSLGLILYECHRGPFTEPAGEHLLRTRQGRIFEEAQRAPLPEPLGRLLRRMLEPDPDARLSSAREGLELLGVAASYSHATPSFEAPTPAGRDGVLASLDEALAAASKPRPRPSILLLEGGRGLGKTRLLHEARLRAFAAGIRSWTWQEARSLAAAPAQTRPDTEARPEAEAAALQRTREAERDREAGAIVEALASTPTALLVDDVDRQGEEDIRLLRAVIARLQAIRERAGGRAQRSLHLPVILLASGGARGASSSFRAAWSQWSQLSWASVQTLEPLSTAACAAWLEECLRPRRKLGAIEPLLIADAAGVPARLRLRLRELARTGSLAVEQGAWVYRRPPEEGLPPLPGESDRVRLEWLRLGSIERDLLGLAAILSSGGEALSTGCARAALGAPTPAIEGAWKSLRGGDLLRSGERDAPGEGMRLDRLRGAWALRQAGPAERRRWRRLLAGSAEAPLLARLEAALRSGVELRDRSAPSGSLSDAPSFDLAATLEATRRGGAVAERVLSRLGSARSVSPAVQAASRLRLGQLLLARGRLARAGEVLEAALPVASNEERPGICLLLGEAAVLRRDGPVALRWLEAAASAAARTELDEPTIRDSRAGEAAAQHSTTRDRIAFGMAAASLLSGELDRALAFASERARARPDIPQLRSLVGAIHIARGAWAEAEAELRAAVELARQRGEPREEASALTNLGRLWVRRGKLADAVAAHQQAAELFERARSRSECANALMNLGAALRRTGEFERSVQSAARSLSIWRELGDDAGAAFCEANLAILARELGLPGTALRRLAAAEEAARSGGPSSREELARSRLVIETRALLALDLGRPEEALRLRAERGPNVASTPGAGAAAGATAGVSAAARELSPEGLLLETRLLELGLLGPGESAGLAALSLEGAPLEERHAPALGALARLDGPLPALAREAREELVRLAGSSGRARLHLALLEAERPRDGAEALSACEKLGAELETTPERDLRRRALVILARRPGARAEALERARGLLRKCLDEVFFDLSPGDRDAFRGRPEIQEAIHMASDIHHREGRSGERGLAILHEVFRLNREILEESRLESILRRAVDAATTLTGAEHGALLLRRAGRLEVAAARSAGKDMQDPLAHISRTVVDRVLSEGKPIVTTDAREDLSLRSIASIEELGLRSVLCLPVRLRSRGKVAGVLYLDNSFERAVFDADDLELTESFCAQAMLAIRAAERRQEVAVLLRQARASNRRLEGELHLTRRDAERNVSSRVKTYLGITGDSAAMRRVFELIESIGPTEIPVLITGESGTGKELVARAVHRASRRAERPFVAENCAAVPAGLLESALFGHAKGAFTGAETDRQGLFELASGGTLFLDEIGEMPPELQTRLLRVLQEKELRPLGSARTLKVDVRIVAATNRDIHEAVARGRLRSDLYYRLQGAEVPLPPLRDRPTDIPLIAERFLKECAPPGEPPRRLEPATLERLLSYPWPGNVRELENEVRRLVALAPGESIGPELLSPAVREGVAGGRERDAPAERLVRPLAEVEKEAILDALEAFGGHRGDTAAALGISRSTLYLKLREIQGSV